MPGAPGPSAPAFSSRRGGDLEHFLPNPERNLGGPTQGGFNVFQPPPNGMSTMNKLEAMSPYFGVPAKVKPDEPYSWWDTENYDLPDALRGKCTYVLNILITSILTSEQWPVTEMLPWKKSEAGLVVKWDEWRFNDSLLDRTPEESVSRMTTNHMNSFTDHLVRRGKAFMTEHGFWMTAMGQKNWAMNVIQIVNSTLETACLGACHAVMTAKPYVDPNDRFRSKRERSYFDINTVVMEQNRNFCRVQKEEKGFDNAVDDAVSNFTNRNGHGPNYAVFPDGINKYINKRPEERYAYLNAKGLTNRNISSESPFTVRYSRGFRVGEHQPNFDPFFEKVAFGGFHVFNNIAQNKVGPEAYNNRHRDIDIFSMSTNDMARMEFKHVMHYLGLYHNYQEIFQNHPKDKPFLSTIGKRFFEKYKSWGDILEKSENMQFALDRANAMSPPQRERFDQDMSKLMEKLPAHTRNRLSPASLNPVRPPLSQPLVAGRQVDLRAESSENAGAKLGKYLPLSVMDGSASKGVYINFNGDKEVMDLISADAPNDPVNIIVDASSEHSFALQQLSVEYLTLFNTEARYPLTHNGKRDTHNALDILSKSLGFQTHTYSQKESLRQALALFSFASSVVSNLLLDYNNSYKVADESEPAAAEALTAATDYVKLITGWLNSTASGSTLKSRAHSQTLGALLASPVVRGENVVNHSALSIKHMAPLANQKQPHEFKQFVLKLIDLSQGSGSLLEVSRLFSSIAREGRRTSPEQPQIRSRYTEQLSFEVVKKVQEKANDPFKARRKEMFNDIGTYFYTIASGDESLSKDAFLDTYKDRIARYSELLAIYSLYTDGTSLTTEETNVRDQFQSQFTQLTNYKLKRDDLVKIGVVALSVDPFFGYELIASANDAFPTKNTKAAIHDFIKAIKVDDILEDSTKREALVGIVNKLVEVKSMSLSAGASRVMVVDESDVSNAIRNITSLSGGMLEIDCTKFANLLDGISFNSDNQGGPLDDLTSGVSKTMHKTDIGVVATAILDVFRSQYVNPNTANFLSDVKARVDELLTAKTFTSSVKDADARLKNARDFMVKKLHDSDFAALFTSTNESYWAAWMVVLSTLLNMTFDPSSGVASVEYQDAVESVVPLFALISNLRATGVKSQIVRVTAAPILRFIDASAPSLLPASALAEFFSTTNKIPISSSDAQNSTNSSIPQSVASETYVSPVSQSQLAEMFHLIPLDMPEWIRITFDHHLPNPLGAIGWRLHKTYQVGNGILMDAYGAAGWTYFGYADFQLGDDIGKKIHVAHFTLYLKSIVQFSKLIVYMHHLFCNDYFGGEGTRIWDPLEDEHVQEFKSGSLDRDIIYAPVLSNFKPQNFCMDISGKYPKSINPSNSANQVTDYESAKIVCEHWRIIQKDFGVGPSQFRSAAKYIKNQTFACQEHQQTFDPKSNDWTCITKNSDPWGYKTYTECGDARTGRSGCLKDPAWSGIKAGLQMP